jgi:hypothetical protein
MKIVLINGKKRSGKDFFAKLLRNELVDKGHDAEVVSFAEPMKKIISTIFGCGVLDLEQYKNNPDSYKITVTEDKNHILSTDFRKVLQLFGTEGMKPIFGTDVWVQLLINAADELESKGVEYVIVPDFRFLIENVGDYTVKVHNDEVESACTDGHSSENELNDFNFDYCIDNTGYKNLEPQIQEFIKFLEQE